MITEEILKRIKLVVVDLDGTLIDDKNNLSVETISLVKKLQAKGVKFSIATGRLIIAFTNHIRALGIDIPVIALDGTHILNPITNEIIYESFLSAKYVQRALLLSDKYFLKIALCNSSAIFYTEENAVIKSLLEKYGAKYTLVKSYRDYIDKTLEVVIVDDFADKVKRVAKKMIFPFTFGVQTSFYKSHNHGGIYYLEIRKMGSSKGKGLIKLCKHLKIKTKDVAVVGDWYNDISLFKTDAVKIAMANAVPEIKRLSNMVTSKDNNEEGINEFLYMLLQAKA